MDNNTGSKHSAINAFLEKYYLVLRYIYPVLLVLGTVFGILGLEFVNETLELVVLIVYYALGIISVVTLFKFSSTGVEIIVFLLLYPILMYISPAPCESALYISVLVALIKKYAKFKIIIIIYLFMCILFGIYTNFINLLFFTYGSNFEVSSQYSDDGKHIVTVSQGWSTAVDLYRVYGNILRYQENILFLDDAYAEVPNVKWIDNDHVKINESIIDIHSDETYN